MSSLTLSSAKYLLKKPLEDVRWGVSCGCCWSWDSTSCSAVSEALIDLHDHEEVLCGLAMALCIALEDGRVPYEGNRQQATVQNHSHHTILPGTRIPQEGESIQAERWRRPTYPSLSVWELSARNRQFLASSYILWAISPGNGVRCGKRYSLLRSLQAQRGHISRGPISQRMNTTKIGRKTIVCNLHIFSSVSILWLES